MTTQKSKDTGGIQSQSTFLSDDSAASRFIVGATGILSVPMDALRTMLADSLSFQEWTNVTSNSHAMKHIFMVTPDASGDYPYPLKETPWPFALINLDYSYRNLKGSGNSPLFAPDTALLLKFEAKNQDYKKLGVDPAFSFLNAVGAVISDLELQSQGDGGLQILSLKIESPERRKQSYTGEPGDFYAIEIKITAGFR
jgi:hypothetical protein